MKGFLVVKMSAYTLLNFPLSPWSSQNQQYKCVLRPFCAANHSAVGTATPSFVGLKKVNSIISFNTFVGLVHTVPFDGSLLRPFH